VLTGTARLPAAAPQGLVGNNSSLKALLQQRDTELAAQQERLEQQGHDLACCEDMLQVIHLHHVFSSPHHTPVLVYTPACSNLSTHHNLYQRATQQCLLSVQDCLES